MYKRQLLKRVNAPKKQLRIGLAGLGNVGAGVYKNLLKNRDLLTERTGAEIVVAKVALRDPNKKRDVDVPAELVTTDWHELVTDPEIDVIVELIGGVDQAYELIAEALKKNKAVVTGNKAVLAERGKELIELAEQQNAPLYCEAAVAGGIPIIKAVKEALVGNRIDSIHGIINGTSNYILTRMTGAGIAFPEALEDCLLYTSPSPRD